MALEMSAETCKQLKSMGIVLLSLITHKLKKKKKAFVKKYWY